MLNRILCYLLLSSVAGSVFSHTLPLPNEKPPRWEQPVVISEEFFPPHPPTHEPSHHLPHNEFKEIIGIELQRIPFHGSPQHEILEHRKYEVLEHEHVPHEHEFLKPHSPREISEQEHREHEILSHELPPPDLLEHEHEHEHHSHEFHNVLEHEHSGLGLRKHERRGHEIMAHEHPHEHEIPEHEHHEHDVAAHQIPHEPHRPPWEDPDFILSEEEERHHHEHEHEFHHEELFPEVFRRRTNRRRGGNSREGNSGRSNSNPNRRENSNRQGYNNRRENSNRESTRRSREGSNINTEELFPRRNRQNINRRINSSNNNNSNNRRNSNNRESSRRNSNIEELAALEEEVLINSEVSNQEILRPERNADSYYNNGRRETSVYESSPSTQSDSTTLTHGFANTQGSSRPANNFEPKGFSEQQNFASENGGGRHSNSGNSRRFTGSGSRRPDRPSSNIFVQDEEYLTLDGLNSQQSSLRPTVSAYNNKTQSWSPQEELMGNSHSGNGQLNRPGEFSNGGSSRPGYLGSRPGSGKPLLPESSKPDRPDSGSSGLHPYDEERPNRPSSGFLELPSNQEKKPGWPNSGSSGLHSLQGERPKRPSSSSSVVHSHQEEKPGRPSPGSSGLHLHHEERPNLQGSSSSSELQSNQKDRPRRPSNSSSGSNLEHLGHFSNQGNSKPSRPSHSHSNGQGHSFHEESWRPNRPSSRPAEENSRPRPTNGNNLSNATVLISVQEDSWLWPSQFEDEDKKNRRVYSGSDKNPSGTTKRPASSSSNSKKQHANLKLLPTESCGVDLGNKIIGGENTQLDEFPWMALLQHSSAEGRALGFGCGGSLISPRYVLTAAHCIKGPAIGDNIRVTKVRLGEFDVSSDVDCQGEICSPPPVDIPVEEIIVHPKYRATDRAQLNDIALIRLRETAKASAYISPICLPLYGDKDRVGEKLTVAGWGKTSNGQKGASSKIKQKVSIPVITLEDCSPFYNRINIQLNNTQMCAGGERGKDSCQGDSGGPLMGSEIIDNQIRWQVHGIVSFGPEDCGIDNVAGVYTKVSEYIDWILDNMKK